MAPLRDLALPAGEYDMFQSFGGFPTISDTFQVSSIAMLCACLCVSNASVWLPSLAGSSMCDSVPLAGKLGL